MTKAKCPMTKGAAPLRHSVFVIRHSLVIGGSLVIRPAGGAFVISPVMAHPLFGPEVKMMLAEKNSAGLREFCEQLHPATVAEALEGDFAPEQIWEVISQANIRTQASIFEYLPPPLQVQLAAKARPQVG